jgi:hypothetical protein
MPIQNHIYRIALHFYPADFHRDFGAEMAGVFSAQLDQAASSRERMAICWYAFHELLTLAIPMRAADPRFVAPAASLLATPALLLPLHWALNHPRALNVLARNAFGHHH